MDKLPPHKVIPGTTFTVDGFRSVSPAVTAYFLSHAHSGAFHSNPAVVCVAHKPDVTGAAPSHQPFFSDTDCLSAD